MENSYITIIHGQRKKHGSSYNISMSLAHKISHCHIEEVYTNNIPHCMGCSACIVEDEKKCPHYQVMKEKHEEFDRADVLIFNTPTHCFEMSSMLKSFFDHSAYRFLLHRPRLDFFNKVAILITTSAGGGHKDVIKSLKKQMKWLGISKIFVIAMPVRAKDYDEVNDKIKNLIHKKEDKIAKKILKIRKIRKSFKVKKLFMICKKVQRFIGSEADTKYWKDNELYKK